MVIKSKKGYALILAMVFLIILGISSIGLYTSTTHFARETGVEEVLYTRGYYASIAGLRLAATLLEDPTANLGFINNSGNREFFDTSKLAHQLLPGYAIFVNFCTDIGVSPNDLHLFISEENPSGGPYRVFAHWRNPTPGMILW